MLEFAVPTNVSEWMQDHVRRYLESDGADGHMWDGGQTGRGSPIPTLALGHQGASHREIPNLALDLRRVRRRLSYCGLQGWQPCPPQLVP